MNEREEEFLAEVLGRPEPPKLVESRERDRGGRFLPGHTGLGGRPPGYDFRTILRELMLSKGKRVEDAVAEIIESLRVSARLGDTAAAKLLLDRTCGKEVDAVDLNVSTRQLTDVERAARLQAILDAAARRKQGGTD